MTEVQENLMILRQTHGIGEKKLGTLYGVKPEVFVVLRTDKISLNPTDKLCRLMRSSGAEDFLCRGVAALVDGLAAGSEGTVVKLPKEMWRQLP